MSGMFARWCQLKGIPFLPVPPAAVAAFIVESGLGPDRIWDALREISAVHREHGYADPTIGGPAAVAMNELSQVEPPRSWPKQECRRFLELPYDLQVYVVDREKMRDREVRRAQSEAAELRRKMANGTDTHAAA